MPLRILIAGVLGGIAMFVWSAIAHMATPLGEIGIQQIERNEGPALEALHASLGERSGLFIFPSLGVSLQASAAEKQKAMEAYPAKREANPSGVLIYHPPGVKEDFVRYLMIEFAENVATALVAAWLVSLTTLAGFLGRAAFVAGIGVPAVATTNVSYWNWYGYPGDYTLAYMATDWLGYVAAGLAIAAILGLKPKKAPA